MDRPNIGEATHMVDQTRYSDLEELAKALDNAKSQWERDRLEKLMYKICHESAPIVSLREELVKAFRVRDMYRVRSIQEHIQRVKQEETYGHSIGGYNEINKYD